MIGVKNSTMGVVLAMSKCNELRSFLLEWANVNHLPLKKKIRLLEKENSRLREQSQRIYEKNKKLIGIIEKERRK